MECIVNLMTTILQSGILIGVAAAGFCIYTKPTRESFVKYSKTRTGNNLLSTDVINVVNKTTNVIDYKDYLVFSTVEVNTGQRTRLYVGFVNNWVD